MWPVCFFLFFVCSVSQLSCWVDCIDAGKRNNNDSIGLSGLWIGGLPVLLVFLRSCEFSLFSLTAWLLSSLLLLQRLQRWWLQRSDHTLAERIYKKNSGWVGGNATLTSVLGSARSDKRSPYIFLSTENQEVAFYGALLATADRFGFLLRQLQKFHHVWFC